MLLLLVSTIYVYHNRSSFVRSPHIYYNIYDITLIMETGIISRNKSVKLQTTKLQSNRDFDDGITRDYLQVENQKIQITIK